MRVIGIDYGSARVGVSLGDTETCIASPWGILENKNRAYLKKELQDLCAHEAVTLIVVGLPLAKDGSDTAQTEDIRAFVAYLLEEGFEVVAMDERFTSRIAEHYIHERGEKKKRDDLAAAVILQGWLDSQKHT